MELTHIHPGLPACPWKDSLLECPHFLSVSTVPPPVVSSSLSSQKLSTCLLFFSSFSPPPLPPHCVFPTSFSLFFFLCVLGDGTQSLLTHPRQEFCLPHLLHPTFHPHFSPSPLVFPYFHFLSQAYCYVFLSLFSQPHPRPTFPLFLFSPLTTCPAPVFLP